MKTFCFGLCYTCFGNICRAVKYISTRVRPFLRFFWTKYFLHETTNEHATTQSILSNEMSNAISMSEVLFLQLDYVGDKKLN